MHPVGQIGPNAIIQTTAALRARVGDTQALAMVQQATGRTFDTMPEQMVHETEVLALVRALHQQLDAQTFEAVLRDAGERTAQYLMAHRIPRPVQILTRVLPASVALHILMQGILRHSWTFAGTAHVHLARMRNAPSRLVMHHCPMCRGLHSPAPLCHFYAATLQSLLTELVSANACVTELTCEATGAESCEFILRVA